MPYFVFSKFYKSQLLVTGHAFFQFFRPSIDYMISLAAYELQLDTGLVSGDTITVGFAISSNTRSCVLDYCVDIL